MARLAAIELFRRERVEEPLEEYLEEFDRYLGINEELLETSVDLTELEDRAIEILSNKSLREAFRYLAGPPISLDDLKTVAEVASLAPKALKNDAGLVRRIVETVMIGLDRRRFPWVGEDREPTEVERSAAVLASAALMATSRVGTNRRSAGKTQQEERVEAALLGAHFQKVDTRNIRTLADSPVQGQFCRESMLGTRKADFIVGLHDRRVLAIECKVSNSATNSVKRLNNDAAAKAEAWIHDFGTRNVVPAAVLSGVYKLHNLVDAQTRGLTLFWAHDLAAMVTFLDLTMPSPSRAARVAEDSPER